MVEFNVDEHHDFFDAHIEEDWGIVDIRCYGGSPQEINGNLFRMSSEVTEWLDQNTSYFEYDETSGIIKIRNPDEAMLFKLAWL